MPLELQATLLRVLESKRVIRVGGKAYKQIDFRLVSATNQNLPRLVSEHRFREDLFYRISVLTVDLPPLRDREGDALYFARYFLNECHLKTGNGQVALSDEAARFVKGHPWPGNVRQLKHAVQSAYYTCEDGVIRIEDFPAYIVGSPASAAAAAGKGPAGKSTPPPAENESSSAVKAVSYTHLDVYKRQVSFCTYCTIRSSPTGLPRRSNTPIMSERSSQPRAVTNDLPSSDASTE